MLCAWPRARLKRRSRWRREERDRNTGTFTSPGPVTDSPHTTQKLSPAKGQLPVSPPPETGTFTSPGPATGSPHTTRKLSPAQGQLPVSHIMYMYAIQYYIDNYIYILSIFDSTYILINNYVYIYIGILYKHKDLLHIIHIVYNITNK